MEEAHKKDENSAPDQRDEGRPTVVDADRARGVRGAEPSRRGDEPKVTHRDKTAAGFHAIYETMRFGLEEMGARRSLVTLKTINQKDGFDCPSCAWPDPDGDRSVVEFCENGAKAVSWEATTARVTPEFFQKHSIGELLEQNDLWLEKQGRITQPMLKAAGAAHYEAISWEGAFEHIAKRLNGLASPDEAVFYTSGRASNEAAFLYGLFAREFGTNNLPDCSNMCHESSGLGLTESIGIGKATVKIDDFAKADAIFVIGQNPGTCHPRMLTELQKAARNGCRIVSVNPLPETGMIKFKHPQEILHLLGPGTPIACLFVPVRVNGDVAVLKGIMKEMVEEDERLGGSVLDHEFITHHTEGFEEFKADLARTSWEEIVEASGVSREIIREAAAIAMGAKRMICCWAMGITQHENGVENVQTIVNFNLLRGQIGRAGAGVCPVRGHSNVQGDRTVGIWEKMSDKFMNSLGKEFGFEPPKKHGHDTVRSIQAMHEGKVKVFVGLGGNFLAATPDTKYTSEALARCTLTVQISTKLNRGHLITGEEALILPCLGRTERDVQKEGEQFVTVEDTVGKVHLSRGVLEPASAELKSEPAIIAGMARATLDGRTTVDWEGLAGNYDRIRDHIEHVVPGFEQYNKRVRDPGGFYLPNEPREGRFPTKTGKAHFVVHAIPRRRLEENQLVLMTIRSHDQFNTTIYGEHDRYRGISGGRRVVFLNEIDMKRLNLRENQWVNLISHYEGETRRAERFRVVGYAIPPRCAAAYYPETNVLVPIRSVARGSNQPASKSIVITVEGAG